MLIPGSVGFGVNVTSADTTAPLLYGLPPPANNSEYTSHNVPLEVASPDVDVFSSVDSLDGGTNIPFTPNTISRKRPVYAPGSYVDDITGTLIPVLLGSGTMSRARIQQRPSSM